VVNLHYILSKASVRTRPSVLWCYKNELGFSSHKKKRIQQIKNLKKKGLLDPEKDDPFELFVASTKIRYCYYKDSHKILGNTFGMLVLQDFEAITPNILARTIETVEGGGLVILLLKDMASLRQMYSMSMDIHSRFRTEAHQDIVARFNERFILSLGGCKHCLAVDDELNILPITDSIRNIKPVHIGMSEDGSHHDTPKERELRSLKDSLKETQPVGALVEQARTVDQARAILTFVEAISEKTLRSTVALTAARGRGKSAALGICMSAAIAYGYSNIFVTSPTPENLNTLFEFIFKGFDALGYKKHIDYEAIESTNPDFHGAIVRVNVFRDHRQTIAYILPNDYPKLAQAELLVIDEAAAIPMPVVKSLLGPYLVFMASTINGYEGTGRSLSLKLISDLRNQSHKSQSSGGGRVLREVTLEEPIRYAEGDPVEAWLHDLLCLNVGTSIISAVSCPHPSSCELYAVNRDTLFSGHAASEAFLQKMMALYVASHYRNTPNDLQLMSDAPAHQLFVLLGPIDPKADCLPDILCVVQLCLEGEISKESVMASLSRGQRAAGDLIPWTIASQFQDDEFARLSGARVVRIAAHPDMQRMGYGSRALELLRQYYEGEFQLLDTDEKLSKKKKKQKQTAEDTAGSQENGESSLLTEELAPTSRPRELLTKLKDRPPEHLHWLGSSFGVTPKLYNYWKKGGYLPVYLRLTKNELTGEHTCIMLRSLSTNDCNDSWLAALHEDFRQRFIPLLGYDFRSFPLELGLEILNPRISGKEHPAEVTPLALEELRTSFSPYDLRRLESYADSLVDYHMILDMVPTLAKLYFTNRTNVAVSYSQAAILLALGLQHRGIDNLDGALESLKSNQILALFNKTVRKLSEALKAIEHADMALTMPKGGTRDLSRIGSAEDAPAMGSMDAELEAGGKEVQADMRAKAAAMIQELDLDKYAIAGDDAQWDQALAGVKSGDTLNSLSVASVSGKKKNLVKRERSASKPVSTPGSGKKQKKRP